MSFDPVLIAYGVNSYGPDNAAHFWQRIGEAYPHETGAGLTVVLDVLPRDGRIVLLERNEHDDARLAERAARLSEQHKRRGGE